MDDLIVPHTHRTQRSAGRRKQDIAQRFSRAAPHYADYAALQAAIADVLLAQPFSAEMILDAGCGRGREALRLASLPGVKKVIALDIAPGMLAGLPASPVLQPQLADMEATGLASSSVDAVFSNFAMQWASSCVSVMTEMARVLKPGGVLLASVPGPHSLAALNASGLRVNPFASIAAWQQALLEAGFEELSFFQQDFALHYPDASTLLRALKSIGAGSSDAPRANHLQGRQWWQQVESALEQHREPLGLPLRYEVIFMRAQRVAAKSESVTGTSIE